MLALFLPLALTASADAAEIQVHAASPVLVTVDGKLIDFPEGQMVGTALGLPGGARTVRVTTVTGNLIVEESVVVAPDEALTLKYANKALREVERRTIGGGVAVSSSGTTETIDVHMGVPGMHVDITINESSSSFSDVEGRLPPIAEAPPLQPVAMGPQDFGRLESAVEAESFSDDQLDLLRTAAAHSWFNMNQVAALLAHLSFSSDQLKALEILRPRIVDPQNSHQLNAVFTFSSDKEAAQAMFR